jgi:predicted phage terminase large subunit-like protein
MPVYDSGSDAMLCNEIMNRNSYDKLKARMCVDSRTKLIFHANYLCEAIGDTENKVFPISQLKRYDSFPEGEYFTVGCADPADEGTDNFSMPIARVYLDTNRVYLFDAIFDQQNLTIQEGQVKGKIKEHKISNIVIETNNAGAYFKRRVIDQNPNVSVWGVNATASKMPRILSMAGIIKRHFYFPNEMTPELNRFFLEVVRLLKTAKKKDDAPDSLAGLAAYLEKYYAMFSE